MSTSSAAYTIDEVAQRLAVSGRTVRRLLERRELGHVRVSRAVRITEAQLAEYLELQSRPPLAVTSDARGRIGLRALEGPATSKRT